MSINFKCPHCGNDISIQGINYKLCPICNYSEKLTMPKGEIVIHEDTTNTEKGKNVFDIIKAGVKKVGKIVKGD